MDLQHSRRGSGPPLLLVHGLGSTRRAWSLIGRAIEEQREVIALDLPGHGATPAEADSGTFAGLARSLEAWLAAEELTGIDMTGSSLGGRLVLEMARRGKAGAVVALDPGGFWEGWERNFVFASLTATGGLARTLSPMVPTLAHSAAARSALLAQLSARPWALNGDLVEGELASLAGTETFDALLSDLCFGPVQEGPAAPGAGPVTIGWGRHDRLTLPCRRSGRWRRFRGAAALVRP
jgi:pimeloyl-ACP methyl ester carboxylesterase